MISGISGQTLARWSDGKTVPTFRIMHLVRLVAAFPNLTIRASRRWRNRQG
jgi:hypothetical protein